MSETGHGPRARPPTAGARRAAAPGAGGRGRAPAAAAARPRRALRWALFLAIAARERRRRRRRWRATSTSRAGCPEIPTLDEYRPPIVTEVISSDGQIAGEFFDERRKVVPYERIPKRVVQAFIASEDQNFFEHGGHRLARHAARRR